MLFESFAWHDCHGEMDPNKVPPEVLNTMLGVTWRLVDSGIAKKSLKVGEKAPDFNLPNPKGESVNLHSLLEK